MEELLEAFKNSDESLKSKIKQQAQHSAAVDVRILALSSLLMEKGFITENEVQDSYKKTFDIIVDHEDFQDERMKGFEEYLKSFLRI